MVFYNFAPVTNYSTPSDITTILNWRAMSCQGNGNWRR